MKRALYLHGFLGGSKDMAPLYLDGVDIDSFDLRKILFEEEPLNKLAEQTTDYDFILGYSFGGRLAGELKRSSPEKAQKWIFVSSRHTPYPEDELKERALFNKKLKGLIEQDRGVFFDYWKNLGLFGGHLMDEYRANHKIGYTPWSSEEILRYLDVFFNSLQFKPEFCENSYYLYGFEDPKYKLEGERLGKTFNVRGVEGGHRFLFEHPEQFRLVLQEIVGR